MGRTIPSFRISSSLEVYLVTGNHIALSLQQAFLYKASRMVDLGKL
jgi:hypothetical protein